jgi:hypothetical protein
MMKAAPVALMLFILSVSALQPLRLGGKGSLISRRSSTADENKIDSVSDVARAAIETQFKVGKSVQWGVLQADVASEEIPDDATRKARREQASNDLVNIDVEERARRTLVGKVSGALAAVSYLTSLYFSLELIPRALITYFPLAISVGFLESGKQGL